MKAFTLVALATATAVNAHAIFQKVSVNGVDQGQLKGLRAPTSNYPIQDINHADFACNTNLQLKDSTVIKVPAGAKVGAWWGHVIGGASGPSDPDNPIAPSHKGPISVYLAKVDNAASASTSGQKWFKIAERGVTSGGVWAVDEMIANNGWHYFDMPTCVAPGQYLMRVELLALHSAYSAGGAQFYMECAQIEVTGSGTNAGANFVSFPGAYPSNDPGIVINIYDNSGNPTNGGRPYAIPGPDPITCDASNNGGGSKPTTTATSPYQMPTTTPPATTSKTSSTVKATSTSASGGGGGGSVALYGQCGGQGYTGPTTCASGTCKESNQWYSQCLP